MSPRCNLDVEDSKQFLFCVTLLLILQHHHTKFGNKTKILWFRRYHPDKYSLTFLTFGVTLTLSAVIQFVRRTLWLIMLYYQTEFGCKRTSSLEDIVEIVIFLLYKPSL